MQKDIPIGLTFDDVLLVPKKSSLKSRKQANLFTNLTPKINLNIPIISANMDTVTESTMAISIARLGGIGIIHRFMSIQDQVIEVQKVKRSESILIDDPVTISPNSSLFEAKQLMAQYDINGILVTVDEKPVGILTSRDMLFETDSTQIVENVMTKELITTPIGTSIEKAQTILHENRIEKLPVIDSTGNLCGLITSVDILKRKQFPLSSKDSKGRLLVGAAIGVKDDSIERAKSLVDAGCDVLVVDIAHGHSDLAIDTISDLRSSLGDVEIIAGNVATPEGTEELIQSGVNAVKVGVGSGSICITRIVTGSGYPQLSALIECSDFAKKYNIPIIADGGVRNSGDMCKALAAGASSIMVGSLLAGTDESPGFIINRPDGRYKMSRGMASLSAAIDRKARETNSPKHSLQQDDTLLEYVPEGVEALVSYKGSSSEVISKLVGGLRSGLSYSGANTISELVSNASFVRITESGLKESKPHDVKL